MTLEEKIKVEAEKLAFYMGKKGIDKTFGPLDDLSSVETAASLTRDTQVTAHSSFEKLTGLFSEWAAEHPRCS